MPPLPRLLGEPVVASRSLLTLAWIGQDRAAPSVGGAPSFEEFLAASEPNIPLVSFLLNLILAAGLSALLGLAYVRWGNALSNRRLFARNFVVLAMTVMLVISIVKSSLALSLGLVGALSIVRFRAAIKEPEELTYLFIAIAIGLGMGANQGVITVTAFAVILAVLGLRRRFRSDAEAPNLHLTVATEKRGSVGLDRIVSVLEKHCSSVSLRRYDESGEALEADFLVGYPSFASLEAGRVELRSLDDSLTISLLERESAGGGG